MNSLTNFLYLLKGFFFPSVCALCGCPLISADEIRYGICGSCFKTLIPDSGRRCNLCGVPLISEQDACLSCREDAERCYDRLWALYPYYGKYRALLEAYKFGKNLALGNFFSLLISQMIEKEPALKNAVIVPVPPRPGKIKKTGWDQVDYLVKRLGKNAGGTMAVCHCLKRGNAVAQKWLSRLERMANLKGRISLRKAAPKTALIIDDVITTGSTLEACSNALKKGGTEKVYGICLFYT
jgi:ComF family protein